MVGWVVQSVAPVQCVLLAGYLNGQRAVEHEQQLLARVLGDLSAGLGARRQRCYLPGGPKALPGAANAGDALWSLLNLELWYRTFIDGDGVQTLAVPHLFASAPEPAPALRSIA